MTQRRPISATLMRIALLAVFALAAMPGGQPGQVAYAATSNTLRLRVESARAWVPSGLAAHQAIPHYHWLVVQDDTGDPTHYGTSLGATDIHNSNYACKPPSIGG